MHFKFSNIYLIAFIYIVVLNIAIALSTLSLHELGHLVVGNYLGCTNIKIVLLDLDTLGTYTQMSCLSGIPSQIIPFSAFIFIVPFSFALYILRGFSEETLWAASIGFNFLLASFDFMQAFQSIYLIHIMNFIGILMIAISEYLFVQRLLDNIESKTLIVRV